MEKNWFNSLKSALGMESMVHIVLPLIFKIIGLNVSPGALKDPNKLEKAFEEIKKSSSEDNALLVGLIGKLGEFDPKIFKAWPEFNNALPDLLCNVNNIQKLLSAFGDTRPADKIKLVEKNALVNRLLVETINQLAAGFKRDLGKNDVPQEMLPTMCWLEDFAKTPDNQERFEKVISVVTQPPNASTVVSNLISRVLNESPEKLKEFLEWREKSEKELVKRFNL
jgi:hypothetical protein